MVAAAAWAPFARFVSVPFPDYAANRHADYPTARAQAERLEAERLAAEQEAMDGGDYNDEL